MLLHLFLTSLRYDCFAFDLVKSSFIKLQAVPKISGYT